MSYEPIHEDSDPTYVAFLQDLQAHANGDFNPKESKFGRSLGYPNPLSSNQDKDSGSRRSSFHTSTNTTRTSLDLERSKHMENSSQNCDRCGSCPCRKKSKEDSRRGENLCYRCTNLVESDMDTDYAFFVKQFLDYECVTLHEATEKIVRLPKLKKTGKQHRHRGSRSCTNPHVDPVARKSGNSKKTSKLKMRASTYFGKQNKVDFSSPDQNRKMYSSGPKIETDYEIFLKHLKEDGTSYVLEMPDCGDGLGVYVKYEAEKRKGNSYVDRAIRKEKQNSESAPLKMSPEMENKLRELLAKPFDQTEYDDLLSEANQRKPKRIKRQLRSTSVSHDTNNLGPRLIDYWPELAEKVDAAEPKKRLTLLRGFFFYIKNICHEGVHPPWLVNSSAHKSCIVLDD